MRIAYNPSGASPLESAPNNDDITFDIPGQSIYAHGTQFKGTDTTYKVVTNATDGLAPKITNDKAITTKDEWVLTADVNGNPHWASLPVTAFSDKNTTYKLSGALSDNKFTTTLTSSVENEDPTIATIGAFVGATAENVGKAGLVPAPNSDQLDYYLKANGSWELPLLFSNRVQIEESYSKASSKEDVNKGDNVTSALGKIEYKADLGADAYAFINAANDKDGTVENLKEILDVLQGIKDTDTINDIIESLPGIRKVGTVTSITLSNGEGISLTNPKSDSLTITESGEIIITNTGVRSITIPENSEKLVINTGGVNTDLIIPYATTAQILKGADCGDSNQPVYFKDGRPTACSFTVDTNVPENAKFTDTWNANALGVAGYIAAPTSTTVNLVWKTNAEGNPDWRQETIWQASAKQKLETGVEIGNVIINNSTTTFYAPINTDTTYEFGDGTNGFKVKPSEGTEYDVVVTPYIENNVIYSGNTTKDTVVIFGDNGIITSSGFTLGKSVPANAIFTDTTYKAGAYIEFGEQNTINCVLPVTDKNTSLSWGSSNTIASIANVDITVTMPPISDSYSNASSTTCLSQAGALALYNALEDGHAKEATHALNADIAVELESAPSLNRGMADTYSITVTAGGKTSDEFEVPYANIASSLYSAPLLSASGDSITVTAGGKTSNELTIPYATCAYYDYQNNVIHTTYATKDEIPSLDGYALKSDIPSLSNYVTKNSLGTAAYKNASGTWSIDISGTATWAQGLTTPGTITLSGDAYGEGSVDQFGGCVISNIKVAVSDLASEAVDLAASTDIYLDEGAETNTIEINIGKRVSPDFTVPYASTAGTANSCYGTLTINGYSYDGSYDVNISIDGGYGGGYIGTTEVSSGQYQNQDLTGIGEIYSQYFTSTSSGAYHTSDIRKKTNITKARNLNIADMLVEFDWKDSGKHSWGYIAQELNEVLPEAVDYNEDIDMYSVNYNVAHSAAIASLNRRIQELENKLREHGLWE